MAHWRYTALKPGLFIPDIIIPLYRLQAALHSILTSSKYAVSVEGDNNAQKSKLVSGYTVSFKKGDKQVPDSRAGIFFPTPKDDNDDDDWY